MKKILIIIAVVVGVTFGVLSANASETGEKSFEDSIQKLRESKRGMMMDNGESKMMTTQERAAKTEDTLAKRKEQLLRVADVLIANTQRHKERVSENENMNDDAKEVLIEKLDSRLDRLAELKANIEAADTLEEFRGFGEAMRRLKSDETRKNALRVSIMRHIAHFEKQMIMRAEVALERLEGKLAELADDGNDVSALEDMLDEASGKVEEAKTALGALKDLVESEGVMDEDLANVKEELSSIHQMIKEAYALMRQVAEGIKAL